IYVDEAAAKAAGHPGVVAPPAMIQVWTMFGLSGTRPDDDPLGKIMELFDDAGYVGVVATNCEQTYHRYLRPGDEVSVAAELTDVVGPKRTALGEGFFITQKITWTVGDDVEDPVAEMMWRIMKFKPSDQEALAPPSSAPDDLDADAMMRPASSRDTRFFWDGVNAHELRIQKRPDGSLQHPPVPAQGHGVQLRGAPRPEGARPHAAIRHRARRTRRGGADAGRAPQCGPRRGGDRNARSRNIYRLSRGRCGSGVDAVRVGARRMTQSMSAPNLQVGTKLPELNLYGDPTFIVSTAIATRDYQDVHHDRDKAQSKGSKDIFVNILTDTGLVQRYITDWAGPNAVIKSISLRLGVPWYAYDTVTFKGEVTEVEDGLITLKVV